MRIRILPHVNYYFKFVLLQTFHGIPVQVKKEKIVFVNKLFLLLQIRARLGVFGQNGADSTLIDQ